MIFLYILSWAVATSAYFELLDGLFFYLEPAFLDLDIPVHHAAVGGGALMIIKRFKLNAIALKNAAN
jgi:hypothetical protein